MLNKKHNLKSGKKNNKDEKGISKRKEDRKPKKDKQLTKENFVVEYFDVVLFMKQKQRRKKRKERDKNKEAKESKKERQEGREKGQEEERDRERTIQKGRPKKAKEKQRETLKNKQKCPFLGGKQGFLY